MTSNSENSLRLGPLIEQLGPLNNHWRTAKPAERVLALWDMGDLILSSIPNPSDPLLWEIQKKSYITRNLLRYALIVRRGWNQRKTVESLVNGLDNYTVFREALPFLKGDREGIDDATYRKVVSVLRATDTADSIRYLRGLKAKKIGRKHRKGNTIETIRSHAVNLKAAFARLEAQATQVFEQMPSAPSGVLVALSQAAVAIATGETIKTLPPGLTNAKGYFPDIAEPLIAGMQSGREGMAALRRLVGADRLMEAADLINSMRSRKTLEEWRSRRTNPTSFSLRTGAK